MNIKMFIKVGLMLASVSSTVTCFATNYTCTNKPLGVELSVKMIKPKVAIVEVKSPFRKKMTCDLTDMQNRTEVVHSFICSGTDGLPDLVAINSNKNTGMIEVEGQPHYDLYCHSTSALVVY